MGIAKKREKIKEDKRQDDNDHRCYMTIKRTKDDIPYRCKNDKLYPSELIFDKILDEFNIVNDFYVDWIKYNNILCAMHLKKYLEEMYENNILYCWEDFDMFKWCSTCRNYINPDNLNGNLCLKCYELSKQNKLILAEEKKMHDRCKYDGCEYEAIKYKVTTHEEIEKVAKRNNLDCVFDENS
jgi:hypothetical protein